MIHSPLEQFEVSLLQPIVILDLEFFNITISFTNFSLYLIISMLAILLLYAAVFYNASVKPLRYQYIGELVYEFIINIVVQQIGNKGLVYAPFCLTLFLIILVSNLIGLLPYAFTPTSQLAMTFFLALTCNLGIFILCVSKYGIKFILFFVPVGAPILLIPIITIIEFISYLLRSFSLSIRLFANMMAGHTLLHILAGFFLGFLNSNLDHWLAGFTLLFTLILIIAILVLEFAIAFLQAYVFVVLFCIYLNEALNPSH
jgi:F-type H+-transporting ATPase subunit a